MNESHFMGEWPERGESPYWNKGWVIGSGDGLTECSSLSADISLVTIGVLCTEEFQFCPCTEQFYKYRDNPCLVAEPSWVLVTKERITYGAHTSAHSLSHRRPAPEVPEAPASLCALLQRVS